MTHKTRQGALTAARAAMGEDAIEGIDFNLKQTGTGWTHEEIPPANEGAAAAQGARIKLKPTDEEVSVADPELGGTLRKMTPAAATAAGYVEAKDTGGNEVWAKPDSPMLVGGVIYPNKTRATEARRLQEQAAAPKPLTEEQKAGAKAAHNAIGAALGGGKPAKAPTAAAAPKKAATPKPAAPEGKTKSDILMEMLTTAGGATSAEMETATGWQPHSVRGFLGTLRKKGVEVVAKKLPKEPTIYRVAKKAPAAAQVGDVV